MGNKGTLTLRYKQKNNRSNPCNMIDIDQLDDTFSIEGEVGFAELEYDLAFVTVSNKYADADICLYGAHVTSFRPHNTMDILWMSPQSNFQVGFQVGNYPSNVPFLPVLRARQTYVTRMRSGSGRILRCWNSPALRGETIHGIIRRQKPDGAGNRRSAGTGVLAGNAEDDTQRPDRGFLPLTEITAILQCAFGPDRRRG